MFDDVSHYGFFDGRASLSISGDASPRVKCEQWWEMWHKRLSGRVPSSDGMRVDCPSTGMVLMLAVKIAWILMDGIYLNH